MCEALPLTRGEWWMSHCLTKEGEDGVRHDSSEWYIERSHRSRGSSSSRISTAGGSEKLPETNAKWTRIHEKTVFGLLRGWPGPPGVARVDFLQIRSGFVDFGCICHRFWCPLATLWGALATKCHPEVDFGRHCRRCLWNMRFASVPGSSLGGADM